MKEPFNESSLKNRNEKKMPTRKKKSRKQRGSRYCGWGQVGQHRGSGGRGGVGKAGGRKHFWIRTIKYTPERYVHKGFLPTQGLTQTNTINVGELEHLLLGTEQEILDLTSLGFEKLLGRGQVRIPIKIKIPSYSIKALEKIESSGGSILE